jgi:hypothetical protein
MPTDAFSAVPEGEFAPIVAPGKLLWGVLEAIDPASGGLVAVRVSGMTFRVDDSLYSNLVNKVGQEVAIVRYDGQWYGGDGE